LDDLAALLESKRDYAGAEPLYRRALGIREKVLGPDHRDTGGSMNNLACLLHSKGDYEAAERLYRNALAIEDPSSANHVQRLRTRIDQSLHSARIQDELAAFDPTDTVKPAVSRLPDNAIMILSENVHDRAVRG
jgi:tetratricopeptide (TPR) repeat protein